MRLYASACLLVLVTACSSAEEVTWNRDVAPIIGRRCAGCHGADGLAGIPLNDYASAAPLAEWIVGAVERGDMPPWLAQETEDCTPRLKFKDDIRVPEEELAILRRWVELGAPEGGGQPQRVPPAETPTVNEPAARLSFQEPYRVAAGGADEFQCFVIDPGLEEKVWVTEVQLVAGNSRVAHHGLVVADLTGASEALADASGRFDCFNPPDLDATYLMMTWTPGAIPNRVPGRTGMPLVPGSRIVVQMHYHPAATDQDDQSTLELKWSTREPEAEAAQALVGNYKRVKDDGTGLRPDEADPSDTTFSIPAGASRHVERMVYRHEVSSIDLPIFAVGTHMHYAGSSMRIDLQRADGTRECLLETPKWDFDWQRTYAYDADRADLPTLQAGDELHLRCEYDNSVDNDRIMDALRDLGIEEPVDIALGDETLDEMCLGMFGLLLPPGLIELGL